MGLWKTKANLEFDLFIGNSKSFHKYIHNRKARENVSLLLNRNWDLLTKDKEGTAFSSYKLMKHSLGKWTVSWTENCQAHRVVVSDMKSRPAWKPFTLVVHPIVHTGIY